MKHALLGSLPGRAIVIGVAIKLVAFLTRTLAGELPAVLGVVDTVAGVAIVVGAAYFVLQLLVRAKRRLLWRVRRKLILSYIFIGVVPAILLVAFFLLSGLLLLFNVSSYLVQTELRAMEDRARLLATGAALEIQRSSGDDVRAILARRQMGAEPDFPGASVALVPVPRQCAAAIGSPRSSAPSRSADFRLKPGDWRLTTAGPWSHTAVPQTIPSWIGCDGFSGLMIGTPASTDAGGHTQMFVRAAAFPDAPNPTFAVVVDLVVSDPVIDRLRGETGVQLETVAAVDSGVRDPDPSSGLPRQKITIQPISRSGLLSGVTLLDYRRWENGAAGALVATTDLSVADVYNRIAAAQGSIGNRSFGRALLLVLLFVVGGLFLIIFAVALGVGLALARSITGSVHELFRGTERVRQGDFTHKIEVKAADQLGELAQSFNSMTASIEELLRQAAEMKRLEEELRIAHEIQMSLLPQGPLIMPGLSVAALCVPAREVGGDYYDFLPLDDHRVGILIADVSGKGTSAALYMAELKGLVLSLSRIHTSPRALLIAANRIIAEHLDARSFISMAYAVVDVRARTMAYARAGHTPLIAIAGPGAGSRNARSLAPSGLVLGLKLDNGELFERLLEERALPLHPGDLYLFFTDGMTEAMNASDDCFGETRLGRFLERHADLKPEELRERVVREIEAFVDGAPQHDDMTMILLKVDDVAPTINGETALFAAKA